MRTVPQYYDSRSVAFVPVACIQIGPENGEPFLGPKRSCGGSAAFQHFVCFVWQEAVCLPVSFCRCFLVWCV